jgi:hypothetical protein
MEKNKTIASIAVLVVLVGLMVWWAKAQEKRALPPKEEAPAALDTLSGEMAAPEATPIDYRNAAYRIEDRTVSLIDGSATMPVAPGSEGVMKTSVLQGPAFADLNGDQAKDAVVILRDEPGGSGIFYYVAALTADGQSSKAVLLGDRVRIKSIEVKPAGVIEVVVLERAPGELMTALPSVERVRTFVLNQGELSEAI